MIDVYVYNIDVYKIIDQIYQLFINFFKIIFFIIKIKFSYHILVFDFKKNRKKYCTYKIDVILK
jgi:hypothetical protein